MLYNDQVNTVYTEIDYNYCLPLFLSCLPNMTMNQVKHLHYMSVKQTIPLYSCGILLGNE